MICVVVHVHADIKVRDKESTGESLKLVSGHIGIEASKYRIASRESVEARLPRFLDTNALRPRMNAGDQAFGDYRLPRFLLDILRSCSNEPVQVCFFNEVRIAKHKMLDAQMSKLLRNMRATTPKTHDAYDNVLENFIASLTEKALSQATFPHGI